MFHGEERCCLVPHGPHDGQRGLGVDARGGPPGRVWLRGQGQDLQEQKQGNVILALVPLGVCTVTSTHRVLLPRPARVGAEHALQDDQRLVAAALAQQVLGALRQQDHPQGASNWKTCVINQSNTNACLKKSIQTAIEDLTTKAGSIVLDLTFLDLDIYGFKSLRIDDVDLDSPKDRLKLKVTITSDFVLNGDYVVKGRLLVVPIAGAGRCNITLGKPVAATGELNWKKQKGAGGRMYAHVEKFQFDFNPKTFKLHFHDKDHGNDQLGKTLNRIANDNANEILKDLKPAISVAFGQAFEDIANRVFSKVPYDDLFPSK
ncbi:hypothetical protein FOCC_FOCC017141 [Frankliniella occidentalis]|nr:hypothetical protein FOCC_FOCC017141 [Frankliniella occidentalis]